MLIANKIHAVEVSSKAFRSGKRKCRPISYTPRQCSFDAETGLRVIRQ